MPSITQNTPDTQPSKPILSFNAGSPGDYEDWRADCYSALLDVGMVHEADLWWKCARCGAVYFVPPGAVVDDTVKSVYVCPENPTHHAKAVKMTCQLRVCPECARRDVFRLLARYMPVVDQLVHQHSSRFRFRKIVLTTPLELNDPTGRATYLKYSGQVVKVFDRLLPPGWRTEQGFIQSAEFGPEGHKLHFHIIFYGQWLDNRRKNGYPLASAWRDVTGAECEVVRIYGVKSQDVKAELIETLKYTTKFWKQDDNGEVVRIEPSLIPVLLQVLKGTRRIRSYGLFYNVPAVEHEPERCPVCDCILVRWSVTEWNIFAQTGWLPDQAALYLGSDIANKSPPETPNEDNRGSPPVPGLPVNQVSLPGQFGDLTGKSVSHYQ